MELSAPDMQQSGRIRITLALATLLALLVSLVARGYWGSHRLTPSLAIADVPLLVAIIGGGGWLVIGLLRNLMRGEWGSDLLAGISIVTSLVMGEYLAGAIVVLMLSGGEALEALAVGRASSVLAALARRMPAWAHRRHGDAIEDVRLVDIAVGDELLVYPHEVCPVDGVVVTGHGSMDEMYLTGEPFRVPKAPGAEVLSGAVNGEAAITIRATKRTQDSRYAKIMEVMRESAQRRPRMRRLGDQLGAWYAPVALAIALAAWWWSGEAIRFLAVLVVATPCPLLIAIPVAILGAVSLSARRGILVRDPAVLELLGQCRTAIFDKTGTLTYGQPVLTETLALGGFSVTDVVSYAAALERYSRHPLAQPVVDAASHLKSGVWHADEVHERPGGGLVGRVQGRTVRITGRKVIQSESPELADGLPPTIGGLECIVLVDDRIAGILRFRDRPREDGAKFIDHLTASHGFERVLLVSGDRSSEVQFLADAVGIRDVFAEQSPEQKVAIVTEESRRAKTLFVGDGINDAPALAVATVGLAFGQNSDITSEAARAVILDVSLRRVDEFLHIGTRMRSIALQSAVGGMLFSGLGMFAAAAGVLPPVAGALLQELIDVAAVVNALRVAFLPKSLTDY